MKHTKTWLVNCYHSITTSSTIKNIRMTPPPLASYMNNVPCVRHDSRKMKHLCTSLHPIRSLNLCSAPIRSLNLCSAWIISLFLADLQITFNYSSNNLIYSTCHLDWRKQPLTTALLLTTSPTPYQFKKRRSKKDYNTFICAGVSIVCFLITGN